MTEPIESSPHMDEEGLACFKAALETSRCYLEYGCGGSTVHACVVAKIPVVISVETDKNWLERVRSSVSQSASSLLIEHCDIGRVADWGRPVSLDRIGDFWRYMISPWAIATRYGHAPDTILIDGRFRVAAFLYSLLSAPHGATILFDDYFDRPHYFVVEEFCKPGQRHGRMAVFTVTRDFSMQDIAARIAQYTVDFS